MTSGIQRQIHLSDGPERQPGLEHDSNQKAFFVSPHRSRIEVKQLRVQLTNSRRALPDREGLPHKPSVVARVCPGTRNRRYTNGSRCSTDHDHPESSQRRLESSRLVGAEVDMPYGPANCLTDSGVRQCERSQKRFRRRCGAYPDTLESRPRAPRPGTSASHRRTCANDSPSHLRGPSS